MCGRYAIFGPVSVPSAAKAILDKMGLDLVSEINQREDQYNIAPTQRALVVARGEGGYEAKALRWGLVPAWAKDVKIGSHAINARAETVAEKPMFRAAFKKRRCLVPASGYFEWQGEAGEKQPYFIRAPAGHLLMFAGLWEAWRPKDEPNADWLRTYTIVTGEPGKVSGDIHDRQPVILQPADWQEWVEGEPDAAAAILRSTAEADLEYYPVPRAVGSPRNKGPELVEPIAAEGQLSVSVSACPSGLYPQFRMYLAADFRM